MNKVTDTLQTGSDGFSLLIIMLLAWGYACFTALLALYFSPSVISNVFFVWAFISVFAGFIGTIFLILRKKWAGWLCLLAVMSISIHGIAKWMLGGYEAIDWWAVIATFCVLGIIQTNWDRLK